jgi:hypothetical protein
MGSAGVSPAVFGLWPKTSRLKAAGGTPVVATGKSEQHRSGPLRRAARAPQDVFKDNLVISTHLHLKRL